MLHSEFKSLKVTQTAVINLKDEIEKVFPLFGAFEERKWADGWDPVLIYPEAEVIEEGTTFKTEGREEETEYIWRVSKYYPDEYLIQYLVSTENRYWTITIKCRTVPGNRTSAEITYTFIGLNEKGNRINEQSLKRLYKSNLTDWEEEINSYLLNLSAG